MRKDKEETTSLTDILTKSKLPELLKAKRETDKLQAQIIKSTKGKAVQLSFLPRSLARVSPFVPVDRKSIHKALEPDKWETVWTQPWGKLRVWSAYLLSTYDEGILLAVLALVKEKRDLNIKTSMYRMCQVLGVTRQQRSYKAIWTSLNVLSGAKFTLDISLGDKPIIVDHVFKHLEWSRETGELSIAVNEYFALNYAQGITNIDFGFWKSLRGNITKCLYRFLVSHKTEGVPFGLDTLREAINLKSDLPRYKKRYQMNLALKELVRKGFLDKKSYVGKDDNVYIFRSRKPEKR